MRRHPAFLIIIGIHFLALENTKCYVTAMSPEGMAGSGPLEERARAVRSGPRPAHCWARPHLPLESCPRNGCPAAPGLSQDEKAGPKAKCSDYSLITLRALSACIACEHRQDATLEPRLPAESWGRERQRTLPQWTTPRVSPDFRP